MPKATFVRDFVWKAKRGVRIAYKAGATYGITSACYAEAKAAGAITAVEAKIRSTPGPDGWMKREVVDDARG